MTSIAEAVAERFRQPLIRLAVADEPVATDVPNTLQRDPWYEALSRLSGIVDTADGMERINAQTVLDKLNVPSKRRDASVHRRLIPLMEVFGWVAIKSQSKDLMKGRVARSFERHPRATGAVTTNVQSAAPLLAVPDTSSDFVAIRGAIARIDDPDGKVLVEDIARNIQRCMTDADLAAKYALTEPGWRQMGGNSTLHLAIRNACETRVRSGAAPREESRVYYAESPLVLRSIMLDDKAPAQHRLEATKRLEYAAGVNTQDTPDLRDRVVINIRLGHNAGFTGTAFVPHPSDTDPPAIDAVPLPDGTNDDTTTVARADD
jgi:hypothetical protein